MVTNEECYDAYDPLKLAIQIRGLVLHCTANPHLFAKAKEMAVLGKYIEEYNVNRSKGSNETN